MVNRENFPIPENIHAPLCCLEIQVPDDPTWKSVVAGLLYELQYWFNWQRDDANSGKECAAVWKQIYLDIDWNLMACKSGGCCQEAAKTYRINPETGQVEQSVDGGVTWQPAAGGLQQYIVQPPPPVTSGVAATKCDAASNVKEQVNQWVTAVSNDFDTATTLLEFGELVILAIVGAVLTILTAGALTAAEVLILSTIAGALYAAWGAGKAVFDAYWVTENVDIVFCAAYCAIGDDGSFTDAQFSEFWNKCNADLPPSPAKMLFMGFLSSAGTPGLNAMAASGFSADSDCSECGCGEFCYEDWAILNDGTYTYGTTVSQVDGVWVIDSFHQPVDGFDYVIVQSSDTDTCCLITLSGTIPSNRLVWYCGMDWDGPGVPNGDMPGCVSKLIFSDNAVPYRIALSFEPCA